MIMEKDQLDQQRFELDEYRSSPEFAELSPYKQELIAAQAEAMLRYSEILSLRIQAE